MARFSFYPLATTLLVGTLPVSAFVPYQNTNNIATSFSSSSPSYASSPSGLCMASSEDSSRETNVVPPHGASDSTRRSFLSKTAGSSVFLALGLMDAPEDAKALGSLKKVNAKLSQ